jgi:hypothetical protein
VIYAVMIIAVFVIPFVVGALAGARYSLATCLLIGLMTVGGLIAVPLLLPKLMPLNLFPWLEDLSVSLAGVGLLGGWAMAGEFAAGVVFGRKNRRRASAAEGVNE